MSVSPEPSSARETVTSFHLSDHLRNRLRYHSDERCLDKSVINECILHGERRANPHGDGDTAIVHEVAGITFEVIVDATDREAVTAYPIAFSRFEAITSNRWSQTQIRSVEQRVRDGKTELV